MFLAVTVPDKSWKTRNPQVSQTCEQIKRSNKKHTWAGLWIQDLFNKYVFCMLTCTVTVLNTSTHGMARQYICVTSGICWHYNCLHRFWPIPELHVMCQWFFIWLYRWSLYKGYFSSPLLGAEGSTTLCFRTTMWVSVECLLKTWGWKILSEHFSGKAKFRLKAEIKPPKFQHKNSLSQLFEGLR